LCVSHHFDALFRLILLQGVLVVEVKTATSIDQHQSVAKFLRDLEHVANLSEQDTMAGVLIAPNKVIAYEMFKNGDSLMAMRYPEILLTPSDVVAETLAYGITRGTFLSGNVSNQDDPNRFLAYLGRGRTSFVFATASPLWPVAKLLTDQYSWEMALHETAQIDRIFCKAQNVDHFMDATLDPTRNPRHQPSPNDAVVEPPSRDDRDGKPPILFYSRQCEPLPNDYFRSTCPDFRDHLQQLLDACYQLKVAGVVHNDLRESNLMLFRPNNQLILGDFGYSQPAGDEKPWNGGTIKTASPSLLNSIRNGKRTRDDVPVPYTFSARNDLWSVMALCLFADDHYANALANVVASHFHTHKEPACDLANEMWRVWATYGPPKWGAAIKLLQLDQLPNDVEAQLLRILLEPTPTRRTSTVR
jgi:serine/threonine protein kinase